MNRLAAILFALLIAAIGTNAAKARECEYEKGEARWDIKNSVPNIGQRPIHVSLASLMDTENIDTGDADLDHQRWHGAITLENDGGRRVIVHEGDIVTVTGYLYHARCQKDGDYHLEIGTEDQRTNGHGQRSPCFIVEVPDPSQTDDQLLKDAVTGTRDFLESMDSSVFSTKPTKDPIEVTVTGQLFFDATHHQSDPGGRRGTRYCAVNVWEIHPITDLH